jgi:hypothetical protein
MALAIFCLRFFRAERGKIAYYRKERTALPKAQYANCVSPNLYVVFSPGRAKKRHTLNII